MKVPARQSCPHVSWNKTVALSSNNIQGIKATALAAYMVLHNALAGLRAFSARSCSEMLVYSNERNRAEFGNMMCSVCQHFIATYILKHNRKGLYHNRDRPPVFNRSGPGYQASSSLQRSRSIKSSISKAGMSNMPLSSSTVY